MGRIQNQGKQNVRSRVEGTVNYIPIRNYNHISWPALLPTAAVCCARGRTLRR